MLQKLFSSKVRTELLSAFFMCPDKDYYLRELERVTGEDYKNISLELRNLEEIGLLVSRKDGNRKYFRLNSGFVIYDELKSIFSKTRGVVGILTDLLSGKKGIEAAFIYGSFASGTESAKSDIDLMVIGDISLEKVLKLIRDPEKMLSREINPSVYELPEIRTRLKKKDPFITQVFGGPRIMLAGSDDDLRRLIK